MSAGLPASFEEKLARIDAIVKELDGGAVELTRATELFKEGKLLVRECEAILKNAQGQIDEAMADPKQAANAAAVPGADEDVPF